MTGEPGELRLQPLMLRLTRKAAAFAAAIDCLTSHLSQAGKNFWNVPAEFESTVTAALRLGPIKASHCNLPLPRITHLKSMSSFLCRTLPKVNRSHVPGGTLVHRVKPLSVPSGEGLKIKIPLSDRKIGLFMDKLRT